MPTRPQGTAIRRPPQREWHGDGMAATITNKGNSMNGKYYSSHENSLLIGFVLFGDLIISNLLLLAIFRHGGHVPQWAMLRTLITSSIIYLVCTGRSGVVLYERKVNNFKILTRVCYNITKYAVVGYVLLTLGKFYFLDFGHMLLYLLLLGLCISVFRLTVRKIVKHYRSSDEYARKVVFVGSTGNNISLCNEMSDSTLGYKPLGYFDDEPNPEFPACCEYLGTPRDVTGYLSAHKDVHELYCCLPSSRKDTILEIIHFCVNHLVRFYSVPNVSNYLHNRIYFNMLGNVPYFSLYNDPLLNIHNRIIKRAFDIAVSAVFLCTVFPIMYVIVAIITKTTMPGPLFFKQKRNGLNGKEFYCIKFRSMKVNDQSDEVQCTKNDPRKTKWGEIMRKTNLDEFPQFINVLAGDMSIVGPRPHMLKHTEEYSKLIDKYMMRHFVKPGITGWSQVTGYRGETKELSQMAGRIRGDIWYIEHWSFWLDIYIIYKTVANVIRGDKEAY